MQQRLDPRRVGSRVVFALTLGLALTIVAAAPAAADTSQASATAVRLTLAGGSLVDSGQRTASNDGTGEVTSGNTDPALGVLGAQTLLSAGALVQQARAFNDGTSAACAGVVGAGGLVQIGPGGDCTVTGAQPGGVVVNLPVGLTLAADAILAKCTASSNGTTTGSASIVNGRIFNPALPAITILALPLSAAPNSGLSVPGVLSLLLNKQTTGTGPVPNPVPPPPEVTGPFIDVEALEITVLGQTVNVSIGEASCGPNAVAEVIPLVPPEGIPLAVAILAGSGGVAWLWLRRRRAAAVAP